ncbi:MAG: hypothetical protein ACREVG_05070, partial [Burkholderiales bacterium]
NQIEKEIDGQNSPSGNITVKPKDRILFEYPRAFALFIVGSKTRTGKLLRGRRYRGASPFDDSVYCSDDGWILLHVKDNQQAGMRYDYALALVGPTSGLVTQDPQIIIN